MTSYHIAPYALNLSPMFSVGDEVFSTRLGRRCTVYGVRVSRLNSGSFGAFYCLEDSSARFDWYPEYTLIKCDPYVRDRLGNCVYVGDTVHDECSHYGFGDQVACKVDASSGRVFVKRNSGSKFGYWCRGRDLVKIAC